jgi:hypothetical protein
MHAVPQNFSGRTMATNRYANSRRATRPMTMFSMCLSLEFPAEADVQTAHDEEHDHRADVEQIIHVFPT